MALSKKQIARIDKEADSQSLESIARHINARPEEVQAHLQEKELSLEPRRKRIFTLIAVCIPFLFFLVLEITLRLFNYGGNLDLFISAEGAYKDYYMCNPNVGHRYFFMQNTVPDPPNDLFLKKKPANGYRIFAVGGSTTAGYPYGNNVMFPRILQFRLQDAFPERHIEVVNTAMTAVNTYTILDFMDEILTHEPDAILFYGGHNEFYGALGAGSNESLGKFRGFIKTYLKLEQSKVFLLVRNAVGRMKKWLANVLFKGDVTKPSATLMERMVAEQTIPLHGPLYKLGQRQFKENLRDILQLANRASVPVILSELVSNVRDQKPFVSMKTDSLPGAETVFQQALRQEKQGHFDDARASYLRAKDLDALRFRASEDFNQVIHEVASEFSVPIVPMVKYFQEASPHGLVGNKLILEHLHPNVDGYFLMADAFFDIMQANGFIANSWDTDNVRSAEFFRQNWGFTELDQAYCDIRIAILKGNWPFKPKSLPNRALLDFRPQSRADSTAFKIWRNDKVNLEHGHVELAEYYAGKRQFLRAFEEYKSLVYMTPLNDSPYLHAADMLVKARQLSRAVPYLKDALELGQSAFANKWLGQIYLEQGKTKEALPFLKKAVEMGPEDPQLLYNLSGAYALDHQFAKAKTALKRLDGIRPNFPGADDLRRQLKQF